MSIGLELDKLNKRIQFLQERFDDIIQNLQETSNKYKLLDMEQIQETNKYLAVYADKKFIFSFEVFRVEKMDVFQSHVVGKFYITEKVEGKDKEDHKVELFAFTQEYMDAVFNGATQKYEEIDANSESITQIILRYIFNSYKTI